MFCPNCGRALPDGAAHCPDCGAEARQPDYCGGFAGITEPPQPQPKDARRERRLLWVIVALSILLLLSAAGTFSLLHERAQSDTPVQTETLQRGSVDRSGANP